ncbi:hypothetical protein BD0084_11710 [Helicobacter pylori]
MFVKIKIKRVGWIGFNGFDQNGLDGLEWNDCILKSKPETTLVKLPLATPILLVMPVATTFFLMMTIASAATTFFMMRAVVVMVVFTAVIVVVVCVVVMVVVPAVLFFMVCHDDPFD